MRKRKLLAGINTACKGRAELALGLLLLSDLCAVLCCEFTLLSGRDFPVENGVTWWWWPGAVPQTGCKAHHLPLTLDKIIIYKMCIINSTNLIDCLQGLNEHINVKHSEWCLVHRKYCVIIIGSQQLWLITQQFWGQRVEKDSPCQCCLKTVV